MPNKDISNYIADNKDEIITGFNDLAESVSSLYLTQEILDEVKELKL